MTTDRLPWKEKLPLGLALLAQSYVIGLWYYRSIAGADRLADLIVAVAAGASLDLIVVTTVMGRRAGRSSGWSWATSFSAFACSSLIALDRYGWEPRSGLHIAFPLVVFLYSQHLAQAPAQAAPEALQATERAPWYQRLTRRLQKRSAPLSASSAPQVIETVATAQPERLALVTSSAYECPHCTRPLKNKQAAGAAKTNGYCLNCKVERKAA